MSDFQETSNMKLEEYSRLPHYMEKEFLYIMYERDKEKIKKLADIVPLERLAAVFNMSVNNIKYILE
jgi:hypothetical protein